MEQAAAAVAIRLRARGNNREPGAVLLERVVERRVARRDELILKSVTLEMYIENECAPDKNKSVRGGGRRGRGRKQDLQSAAHTPLSLKAAKVFIASQRTGYFIYNSFLSLLGEYLLGGSRTSWSINKETLSYFFRSGDYVLIVNCCLEKTL